MAVVGLRSPRATAWAGIAVVAAVVVDLLAGTGASPWATADLLVVSLVAVALTTAVHNRAWVVGVPVSSGVAAPQREVDDVPASRDRPTDPVHHPLAPRAPGPR